MKLFMNVCPLQEMLYTATYCDVGVIELQQATIPNPIYTNALKSGWKANA